jgi:hypothetical protein
MEMQYYSISALPFMEAVNKGNIIALVYNIKFKYIKKYNK